MFRSEWYQASCMSWGIKWTAVNIRDFFKEKVGKGKLEMILKV